ncbi:NAD(P)-dependent oxidoreductase [Curtobacterium sp. MCPF17_011]|uniref:SDR family oxidoreductase n=1 Tax=Curtobacterium sp. MCPF17_011 TaxID=2175652 RepID=UPI000DA765CA|nr:SDR family oxidoreductase [Curtobacterium sp. MCPF17_011]PZF15536.1 NAD(P)-dependent oxidoreductase [Curtobacterium sp. MCPF17_011]
MTIAVTGATGNLGRLIVEHLLARGVPSSDVVAIGRNAERLSALFADSGVRTAFADYTDPAALASAFDGVETLVLVSGSEVGQRVPQHTNAIRAAEQAGVQHIVYTSAPRADTSTLFVAPEHKATEDLLGASPVTATVLRNNWYNENYEQAFAQIAATGQWLASSGTGRIASASRSDYAEAAAVVAAADAHRGETLELAGDTAWDGAEFAATASRVLGRDVAYAGVSSEEHQEALVAAGLDEGTIGFLVGLDAAVADGALDGPSTVLSTLTGHPTETLEEAFRRFHTA